MPKELNFIANERIDLEDLEYGTRTFTVDSLKAQVTRLISGGYRGGFVLEGFRVELPPLMSDMSVTVSNGIALDRAGRLITREEGNFFLNNPKEGQTVALLEGAAKNYLMVEFTFIDADDTDRAFWDPTYENSPLIDSDGDSVPQPKGKESTATIPTRKASSWTCVVSATGFEDATDPSKLRIPIAIIPIDTSGPTLINLTPSTDGSHPQTTIMEKPVVSTTIGLFYVYCADVRIFDDIGYVSFFNKGTNSVIPFNVGPSITEIPYKEIDRENNIIWFDGSEVLNVSTNYPAIGDIVRQIKQADGITAPPYFVDERKQYDCRPMFFSFTEWNSALAEDETLFPTVANGDRETGTRNNRYWSGISLVIDPETSGDGVTQYPATVLSYQKNVTLLAARSEERMKQFQDFCRVLGSLIREMKYGVASTMRGTWTENPSLFGGTLLSLNLNGTTVDPMTGSTANNYVIDANNTFTQSFVGAYIVPIDGLNPGVRRRIDAVIGEHVLHVSPAWTLANADTNRYKIELNFPSEEAHKYVDAREIGSLNEVWDARIDQFTQSYAEDLGRRLSMNKVATITVGDGVNTHGDFVGDAGLRAAFDLAYRQRRGATIYIREGSYNLTDTKIFVGPYTTIVGDGPERTNITLTSTDVASPVYFETRDYLGDYYLNPTSTITQIQCKSIYFEDLSITSTEGYPCISNADMEFQDFPGNTAPVGTLIGDGIFVPIANSSITASLLSDFKLKNVSLQGGGIGNWILAHNGFDTTYMVYIVSDEELHTDYTNERIEFVGCNFNPLGGIAVLKSCKNVDIKHCHSETDPSSTVEGITFCSRTDTSSGIYNGGFHFPDRSDRNVLISECIFEGYFADELNSTNYPSDGRGWINFTPSYLGQNIKVEGCEFIGDRGGTVSLTTSPRPDKRGQAKRGRCIVSCFPFDVLVSDCLFHTYIHPIITQYGLMKLSGCNFWNCSSAITCRGEIDIDAYNYTLFSTGALTTAAFNFWNPMGTIISPPYYNNGENYFRVEVYTCNFDGCANGVVVGSTSQSNVSDSFNTLRSYIKVNSSTFYETTYPINWVYLYGSNGDISFLEYTWELIEVTDCNIIGATLAVKGPDKNSAGIAPAVAGSYSTYHERQFFIKEFNYKDNNHVKSVLDLHTEYPDEKADGYAFICADFINITNNNFSGFTVDSAAAIIAADRNPIIYIGAGRNLNCSSNVFQDCLADEAEQITAIEIGLMASQHDSTGTSSQVNRRGPFLVINGNVITNKLSRSSSPRLINGVYITHRVTDIADDVSGLPRTGGILDDGPHIQPWLEFCDNDFNLVNGNFGFLAVQHNGYVGATPGGGFTGTYSFANFWEWFNVSATNNSIRIDAQNQTLHQVYGNDLGSSLTTISLRINSDTEFAAGQTGAATGIAIPKIYGGRTAAFSFLGGASTQALTPVAITPTVFIACLDLRRCYFGDGLSTTNQNRQGSVTVANNILAIERDGSVATSGEDVHEVMGLRIAKFPLYLAVKNNTFDRAPFYAKWTWNNPWHTTATVQANSGTEAIGFTMDIEDNTFITHTVHACVDINPATGFGHGGDSASNTNPEERPTNMYGYANINFRGNTVKGDGESIKRGTTATPELYWPYKNVVRLWHANYRSWCMTNIAPTPPVEDLAVLAGGFTATNGSGLFNFGPADGTNHGAGPPPPSWDVTEWYQAVGGFGVMQNFAKFQWNISNNQMTDSIFKITEMLTGGSSDQTVVSGIPKGVQRAELQRPTDGTEPYWQFGIFDTNSFILPEGLDILHITADWPGSSSFSSYDVEFSIWGVAMANSGALDAPRAVYPLEALYSSGGLLITPAPLQEVVSQPVLGGNHDNWILLCINNSGIIMEGNAGAAFLPRMNKMVTPAGNHSSCS